MIDYKTFTINTNIILLINNVFSKLLYTISFINYCNCYKLYTQCWPYQIFVHGALHGVNPSGIGGYSPQLFKDCFKIFILYNITPSF